MAWDQGSAKELRCKLIWLMKCLGKVDQANNTESQMRVANRVSNESGFAPPNKE